MHGRQQTLCPRSARLRRVPRIGIQSPSKGQAPIAEGRDMQVGKPAQLYEMNLGTHSFQFSS